MHPARAVVKVMSMTTGELDYDDIFHQQEGEEEVGFPLISFPLWVIFLVMMPVLLNNYLVRWRHIKLPLLAYSSIVCQCVYADCFRMHVNSVLVANDKYSHFHIVFTCICHTCIVSHTKYRSVVTTSLTYQAPSCCSVLQAIESWAKPGNKANKNIVRVSLCRQKL